MRREINITYLYMYIFKNIQDEECLFYDPKCQISRPLKVQGQIDHID